MGRVFACAAAVARNKLHARFDVGADDFVLAIVEAPTTKHTGELVAKVADSVGLRHKLEDLFYRQKSIFSLLRRNDFLLDCWSIVQPTLNPIIME